MTDILVAGGGLSGSSAAILLARTGRTVHLIERHAAAKDKICGEFLSIEAQQHLTELGIDLTAMGAAVVTHIRVVAPGRKVETRLPFVARGISRRLLDEALLTRAAHAGVTVERGVRVLELAGDALRTSAGERRGATLLLATGKLPVRADDVATERPIADAHVGFKMHWRASPDVLRHLEGCIELALFPGGYAGVQMVEGGTANLCLVIRRSHLATLGGRWDDIIRAIDGLSSTLTALVQSEPLFDKPLTIANLPYGRLTYDDGAGNVFRLGDQAAMTASLTGDGMAIALRSGWLAARHIEAGGNATDYHRALRAMVRRQVRRGMALQRATETPALRSMGLALLTLRPSLLRNVTRMTRLPDLPLDCRKEIL